MKNKVVLILSLLSVSFTSAQEQFVGKYKGPLVISSDKGIQEVPMEFHLLETEVEGQFDYVLIYDNKPRNYTLIRKDKEKGEFILDENNGIVLPVTMKNNILYSFFEVQDNILTSRLEFKGDILLFEILFSNKLKKTTSGGNAEAKATVDGYPISVVQKAVLKKQ